jgi:hypothetical protein
MNIITIQWWPPSPDSVSTVSVIRGLPRPEKFKIKEINGSKV